MKKKQAYDKCQRLLKEYFENSVNTAFYIRGINTNNYTNATNIPLPRIIISQDEIEPFIPPPSNSPPPPPTEESISNDNTDFEMEIIEETEELEVQSISSEDSELANVPFNSNPFESTFNLPRTPPNFNYSRSMQQSPFQMNMFRRS